MISYQALIDKFQQAYTERWGYILNKAGVIYTQKEQDYAIQMYEKAVAAKDAKGIERWEMTAKYGTKWIGRKVSDCSGLFAWAFKELGSYIEHGSNTIWGKRLSAKGELKNGRRTDGQTLRPGSAVFRVKNGSDYHHIGLYIGNGKVIEAQGTQAGVTISSINRWHTWGELKGVDYGAKEVITMDEYYKEAVVVAEGGVNFRTRASVSAPRITTIPQGTEIAAFDMNNGWCKIKYNGREGYAMTKYISFNPDAIISSAPTNTVQDNADALKLVENIEKELANLKKMLQA